jgi:D-alanine-D-alanine ligase
MTTMAFPTNMPLPSAASLGRVAVLYGGASGERDISIRSGEGVLAALKRSGVNAFGFDPAVRALHELADESADRAFIALHGRYGEDGTVQGALEMMKIPYTGSGVMASSVAMDKSMTKRVWITHGLPTPKFRVLHASAAGHVNAQEVAAELGLPLAVKPATEGSSLGFSKVTDAAGLDAALALSWQHAPAAMVEQFVQGREFTCALLESAPGFVHALPVIEIVAPQGNYDYQNKYFGDATRYLCPAPISAAMESQMREICVAAFMALDCAGWARADLMWDEKNDPMLLEINTSPGMTDHSLVPMAARQAGMSYEDLVMRIASQASLKLGHAA